MITSITLENFKCFRKVEVNPRLITVLVGPNGTGKSSVLQAMALLKQSVGANGLTIRGNLVNLQNHQSLLPNFEPNHQLTITIGGSYQSPKISSTEPGANVDFLYNARFAPGRILSHWGTIAFNLDGNAYSLAIDEDGNITPNELNLPGVTFGVGQVSTVARFLEILGVRRGTSTPPLTDFLSAVLLAPIQTLQKMRFVPAARGLVRPVYGLGAATVDDVSGAGGLSEQEQQTATNLGYSRRLEDKLSGLLQRVTGMGLKAETVPPQSVEVKSLGPAGEVNMVAEGFGANGLILLFMQLAGAEPGATVLIEEPEIHLHPRAQAELASVLVDEARADGKQIIMTTHSEHILSRLLTLVAEKKLSADELAIYAFEKDDEGVCAAQSLEVTQEEKVTGGIKDFFESDLAELDRYVRALQSRE